MARKIYLNTAAIISLCFGIFIILSACLAPVDMDEFFKPDGPADNFINNTVNNPSASAGKNIVKVDDKTGDGLKGEKGKITGLKGDRYYMVEKETDDKGDPVIPDPPYPLFVTDFLVPGGLFFDLGVITIIGGDKSINNLQEAHTYTVRAATSFFDGFVFTYSDSTGAQNQTVSVKNGAITLSAPQGDGKITLEQLNTQFNGYDVIGVAVNPAPPLPPTSPFYNRVKKTISDTDKSFQLEGANTEVDYVFVKPDVPANFFYLKVKIGNVINTINIPAITGVTPPVAGVTPVAAITPTAQYTGTITWSPAVTGTFAASTSYTATITLSPAAGYTLSGVAANFFTVEGATTVSNSADSGVVTAVFPATASTISDLNILGVTPPVTGAIPAAAITPTAQYTGTITWSPAVTGTFAGGQAYTATINLTPAEGYTLTGVAADSFKVTGAAVNNTANSGVVTAVFPATNKTISDFAILGVTRPVTGATPAKNATNASAQYTGSITWDHGNPAAFAEKTVYTATITLSPAEGYTLTGVSGNPFTVEGATSVSYNSVNNIVTAEFPATGSRGTITITFTISDAGINGDGNPASISYNEIIDGTSLIFTLTGGPYTSATWTMNGTDAGGSTTGLTIDKDSNLLLQLLVSGTHTIDVLCKEANGSSYSGYIKFEVN